MKEIRNGSLGTVMLLIAVALGSCNVKIQYKVDGPELAEEEALGRLNGGSADYEDGEMEDEMPDAFLSTVNLPMEVPVGGPTHGMTISHEGFLLSYDTINHNPFWVAWELTGQESRGRVSRADLFQEDPALPARHSVRPSAYSNTGYTRGHMCPAGDQKWSQTAMDDCFYMSNMCPQTAELNRYWWDWLERAERQWAKDEGSVYIVCGPIYDDGKKVQPLKKNKFFVGIPDRFFKVILSTRKGKEKAVGFIYANDDSEQYLEDCVCSVDDVEKITGYDFFSSLSDAVENRIEHSSDLDQWSGVPMPIWE